MKIKSAKSFRFWYKTKIKEIDRNSPSHNEDFIGTYHLEKGKKVKGFFEMYHGDKPDIAGYLPSILKIAEDGQAIYEFLQNAVDCNSTHFYIFYNEKYFLAINNGDPFDVEGLQSILNIAQTTKKDADKIGRFGIGFKLAHRLVGKNEGTEELVKQYKGPVLFSWSKQRDLEELLSRKNVIPVFPNLSNSAKMQEFIDAPYLLKLILTNFPTEPDETVKDLQYKDHVLFPQSELNEMIDFLNENLQKHSESLNLNVLKQGSMFFIKLGEGKKAVLDRDYNELVNGIQYSMNMLKNLKEVYINENHIEQIRLWLDRGRIPKESESFQIISPEYKEFDIQFGVGYPKIKFGSINAYENIQEIKKSPNFYKYFPMGDETNGFGFIVHCDSFSNEANRRKLQQDEVNKNLFPHLANFIINRLKERRDNIDNKPNSRNNFLNLYISLLLSEIPNRQNNNWLKEPFYDKILDFIKKSIPTKEGYSDNAQNVKINQLKIKLNLLEFGLGHIQWFEWDSKADQLVIDEAKKQEKLGIEGWNITDIIENADLESINNWIANCEAPIYKAFLDELEKSDLGDNNKKRISEIKLFKFSNDEFYSFNDIVSKTAFSGYSAITYKYRYNNVVILDEKTIKIKTELQELGFITSSTKTSDYPKIFSCVALPPDKDLYGFIAEKCKTNSLTSVEKQRLFINLSQFDKIGDETLKELCLFCDNTEKIQPLSKLVNCTLQTPYWINPFKIKSDEYFDKLKSYLISDEKVVFENIIMPNLDSIISKISSNSQEISTLIRILKNNDKEFFKNYIIIKQDNQISIIPKTVEKFQVDAPNNAIIKSFADYCSERLYFVLPSEFKEFHNEVGIISAKNLLLDIVENSKLVKINEWISDCSEVEYNGFLNELEKSNLSQKAKERICTVALFKCSNNNFYAANEIKKDSNLIFHSNKTIIIKNELEKLDFVTSIINISRYKNIFAAFVENNMFQKEDALYNSIAEKCKTNTLLAEEKKKLFRNFINPETQFDNVNSDSLKTLCLFCDNRGNIQPLCKLVNNDFSAPLWIDCFKIKDIENFEALILYLISERNLYQEIIVPKWDEIIESINSKNVGEFYEKVKHYYSLNENNIPFKNQKIIYINEDDGLLSRNDNFFYNSKLVNLESKYFDFQSAVESLLDKQTPYKHVLRYLQEYPFKIDSFDLFDGKRIYQAELNVEEVKALLEFCTINKEQFFLHCVIEKDEDVFIIQKKDDNKFQIASYDKRVRKFINENCSESLILLPDEFSEYENNEGIIKSDDLYSKIVEIVDVNDLKESLVDVVHSNAKLQFLRELSEIRLYSETTYTKESYEYKVLEMACSKIKESDLKSFRDKIIIEIEESVLSLSDIPPFADKITIDGVELLLSKILPDSHENSNVLGELMEQFVNLGLQREKLDTLFGIETEPEPEKIFELLSENTKLIDNEQQLAFLLLYDKDIDDVDFEKFEVETLGDNYHLADLYYTQRHLFILKDAILNDQYKSIENLLPLPVEAGKETQIIKHPYFSDENFICPYILEDMDDDQKLSLIEFLFDQWTNNKKKTAIKTIDWSKINEKETAKLLGFNPDISVYPNEYACKNEQLPEYLIKWIDEDEPRIQFLSDLGIWTENSVVVELRKFLKGDIDTFNKARLSQTTHFNDDETMLFNSFEWLKDNEIKLETEEQYETFKKVVEVINGNRDKKGDLVIQEEYDFELLEEETEEWKDTDNYSICLNNGALPKIIKLDEIDDFIFYRFNEDDFVVNGSTIYINGTEDKKKHLQKVASDDSNDFSFEDLWALFGESADTNTELINENSRLHEENTKLKTRNEELENLLYEKQQLEAKRDVLIQEKIDLEKLAEKVKNEPEVLKNIQDTAVKIRQISNEIAPIDETISAIEHHNTQIQRSGSAVINSGYGGLSIDARKTANYEAKEIVKNELEKRLRTEKKRHEAEGKLFSYNLTGFDGYSNDPIMTINSIRYPIVIKSYKWQNEPFKINPNEWEQLITQKNALFFVWNGNTISHVDILGLLRNQSHLTISFGTENLDKEDRLKKFAEVLHFFKDIHFEFTDFNSYTFGIATKLNDYFFDTRKTEEDISDTNSDIML